MAGYYSANNSKVISERESALLGSLRNFGKRLDDEKRAELAANELAYRKERDTQSDYITGYKLNKELAKEERDLASMELLRSPDIWADGSDVTKNAWNLLDQKEKAAERAFYLKRYEKEKLEDTITFRDWLKDDKIERANRIKDNMLSNELSVIDNDSDKVFYKENRFKDKLNSEDAKRLNLISAYVEEKYKTNPPLNYESYNEWENEHVYKPNEEVNTFMKSDDIGGKTADALLALEDNYDGKIIDYNTARNNFMSQVDASTPEEYAKLITVFDGHYKQAADKAAAASNKKLLDIKSKQITAQIKDLRSQKKGNYKTSGSSTSGKNGSSAKSLDIIKFLETSESMKGLLPGNNYNDLIKNIENGKMNPVFDMGYTVKDMELFLRRAKNNKDPLEDTFGSNVKDIGITLLGKLKEYNMKPTGKTTSKISNAELEKQIATLENQQTALYLNGGKVERTAEGKYNNILEEMGWLDKKNDKGKVTEQGAINKLYGGLVTTNPSGTGSKIGEEKGIPESTKKILRDNKLKEWGILNKDGNKNESYPDSVTINKEGMLITTGKDKDGNKVISTTDPLKPSKTEQKTIEKTGSEQNWNSIEQINKLLSGETGSSANTDKELMASSKKALSILSDIPNSMHINHSTMQQAIKNLTTDDMLVLYNNLNTESKGNMFGDLMTSQVKIDLKQQLSNKLFGEGHDGSQAGMNGPLLDVDPNSLIGKKIAKENKQSKKTESDYGGSVTFKNGTTAPKIMLHERKLQLEIEEEEKRFLYLIEMSKHSQSNKYLVKAVDNARTKMNVMKDKLSQLQINIKSGTNPTSRKKINEQRANEILSNHGTIKDKGFAQYILDIQKYAGEKPSGVTGVVAQQLGTENSALKSALNHIVNGRNLTKKEEKAVSWAQSRLKNEYVKYKYGFTDTPGVVTNNFLSDTERSMQGGYKAANAASVQRIFDWAGVVAGGATGLARGLAKATMKSFTPPVDSAKKLISQKNINNLNKAETIPTYGKLNVSELKAAETKLNKKIKNKTKDIGKIDKKIKDTKNDIKNTKTFNMTFGTDSKKKQRELIKTLEEHNERNLKNNTSIIQAQKELKAIQEVKRLKTPTSFKGVSNISLHFTGTKVKDLAKLSDDVFNHILKNGDDRVDAKAFTDSFIKATKQKISHKEALSQIKRFERMSQSDRSNLLKESRLLMATKGLSAGTALSIAIMESAKAIAGKDNE
jgi:hypothetical protein